MTLWRVELSFPKCASFAVTEEAPSLDIAIGNAERYAKASGWTDAPIKRHAFEVYPAAQRVSDA